MKKFIGKLKIIFIYILIFASIGTILDIVALTLADNFVYSLSQSSEVTGESSKSNEKTVTKLKIEDGSSLMQYSFNNKYYTYLKDKKIYINTVEDAKNVDIIEEDNPICYYNLLYDKNLILYFTQVEGKNSSKLQLKTYEISTKKKMSYNTFTVNNFSCIKDMNMSPIINMIYINVETKTTKTTNNIIYKVDLFNSMTQVKSGIIIDKMIMLQHTDKIYYEDSKSNIYVGNSLISLFKEKVDMIGIDVDDNLYFISKESKDKIYVVLNNKIKKTIDLKDTGVIKTYSNNEGVYLVYPTYVVNVVKDVEEKIGKMSGFVNFEAIKGDTMYLKTQDNNVLTTKILTEE